MTHPVGVLGQNLHFSEDRFFFFARNRRLRKIRKEIHKKNCPLRSTWSKISQPSFAPNFHGKSKRAGQEENIISYGLVHIE